MIEAKIEPRDLIELDLAMKKLDAEVLLVGEWVPFLEHTLEVIEVYPPVPQDSNYLRTGNLFASWHVEQVNPLMGQIQNVAEYAGYVQGHDQTAQHAGTGWIDAFKKAKDLAWHFVEKIGDKAEAIWEGTWNG